MIFDGGMTLSVDRLIFNLQSIHIPDSVIMTGAYHIRLNFAASLLEMLNRV